MEGVENITWTRARQPPWGTTDRMERVADRTWRRAIQPSGEATDRMERVADRTWTTEKKDVQEDVLVLW
jgi:hypothetical protein